MSRARAAAGDADPRKKGENRAGRCGVIPVIKMIGARIVLVDRLLHEAQAEDLGVEIQITLRIGSDRGDMMEPGDVCFHEL